MIFILSLSFFLVNSVPIGTSNTQMNSPVFHLMDDDNSTDDGFDDSDGDGIDDDIEHAYEREIEYESEVDRFKSKSTLKNGTTKDVFEVEFDVQSDNAAEIKFKFSNSVAINSSANNESELSYKVKFDKIVEFIDSGEPGYQNETIVSFYEIGNAGWNDLQVHYNTTLGYLQINATTQDGLFTLVMMLTSGFLNRDNVTITPNSLKIDVYINNYNLTSSDTKLAIKTHIKTEAQLQIEQESEEELEGFASNETQVEISMANTTGYFSWAEFAEAMGSSIDVIASTLENSTDEEGETSQKTYFTFDAVNVSSIYWDPKMGVVSQAAKQNVQQPPIATEPVPTTPISSENSTTLVSPTTSDLKTDLPRESTPASSVEAPFSLIFAILPLFAIPLLKRRQ
ncbi:MAG: hypothetical protein D6732_26870 [Methanobacteriota archaeon]|nr:MAG: hypothetical protein D6732_26870 [Euryarchaeota archaeon]